MKSSTSGGSGFECEPPPSSSGVVEALLILFVIWTTGGPEPSSSCSVANSHSIHSGVSEASADTESVLGAQKVGLSGSLKHQSSSQ
jgi:hypothetical protein